MKSLSFDNDPAPRLSRNDIAKKAAQFLPNSSTVNSSKLFTTNIFTSLKC